MKSHFRWKLGKFLAWLLMKFLWGIRAEGLKDIPPPPVIVVANHSSYMDPPIIMALWPREIYFIAHRGLFVNPLFGAFLRFFNAMALPGAYKRAYSLLKAGYDVAIFPEGGRNRLPDVKPGAFKLSKSTGAPILILKIHNNDGKPPLKWIRWFFKRDFYIEKLTVLYPQNFESEERMLEAFRKVIFRRP